MSFQVGFGNVAAETDNERVFTICMMIIAGAVIDVPLRFRLDTRAFISFEIYDPQMVWAVAPELLCT